MRRATTIPPQCAAEPRGQLPDEDNKSRLQKAREGVRALLQRPSSGRTTSLGRKVEKPDPRRQGGPSGQTDAVQHDRKHTNK